MELFWGVSFGQLNWGMVPLKSDTRTKKVRHKLKVTALPEKILRWKVSSSFQLGWGDKLSTFALISRRASFAEYALCGWGSEAERAPKSVLIGGLEQSLKVGLWDAALAWCVIDWLCEEHSKERDLGRRRVILGEGTQGGNRVHIWNFREMSDQFNEPRLYPSYIC